MCLSISKIQIFFRPPFQPNFNLTYTFLHFSVPSSPYTIRKTSHDDTNKGDSDCLSPSTHAAGFKLQKPDKLKLSQVAKNAIAYVPAMIGKVLTRAR